MPCWFIILLRYAHTIKSVKVKKYVANVFGVLTIFLSACGASSSLNSATPSPASLTATEGYTETIAPSPTVTPTATLELPVLAGTPLPQPSNVIEPENVSQLVQLAHWGDGKIVEVAWSPNDDFIAVATSEGVYLYETNTFQKVDFLRSASSITSTAFSPNGDVLAIGLGFPSHAIKLWDLVTNVVEDLETEGVVFDISYSPDGKLLAYAVGKEVLIRDAKSYQIIYTLVGHQEDIQTVSFSPDGKILASHSWDRIIKLWNTATGENLQTLAGGGELGRLLFWSFFSPAGPLVVSDGEVFRLWDIDQGKTVQILHSGFANPTAISQDGRILATGYAEFDDGIIKIWDMATGMLLRSIQGYVGLVAVDGSVNSLSISPDGRFLVSSASGYWGQSNGDIKIWELANGDLVHTIKLDVINAMAFSPDNKVLALGSGTSINLWDVSTMKIVRTLEGEKGILNTLSFAPNGQLLIATYIDTSPWAYGSDPLQNEVLVWNVATGEILYAINHRRAPAIFSPDGSIFTTIYNKELELRSVVDNHVIKRINYLFGPTTFSPDGKYLAYAWANGSIKVTNLANDQTTILRAGDNVVSLMFSPDGTLLASGTWGGSVQTWDWANEAQINVLGPHANLVMSVAFSPNGRLLASGGGTYSYIDNTLNIWDMEESQGEFEAGLPGLRFHHTFQGQVWKVVFSPNGRLVAVLTSSGSVDLWAVQ